MPNEALITIDPIVAQNFFLEIDGAIVTILASVSGLDVEMEVVTTQQVGKDGKIQVVKTLGKAEQGAGPVIWSGWHRRTRPRTSCGAGSTTSATRASC